MSNNTMKKVIEQLSQEEQNKLNETIPVIIKILIISKLTETVLKVLKEAKIEVSL